MIPMLLTTLAATALAGDPPPADDAVFTFTYEYPEWHDEGAVVAFDNGVVYDLESGEVLSTGRSGMAEGTPVVAISLADVVADAFPGSEDLAITKDDHVERLSVVVGLADADSGEPLAYRSEPAMSVLLGIDNPGAYLYPIGWNDPCDCYEFGVAMCEYLISTNHAGISAFDMACIAEMHFYL